MDIINETQKEIIKNCLSYLTIIKLKIEQVELLISGNHNADICIFEIVGSLSKVESYLTNSVELLQIVNVSDK